LCFNLLPPKTHFGKIEIIDFEIGINCEEGTLFAFYQAKIANSWPSEEFCMYKVCNSSILFLKFA
jgi:hypothetical protein